MEEIRSVIDSYIQYKGNNEKITSIALQGGYARGNYSGSSDIDLVLLFDSSEDGETFIKGRENYDGYTFEVRHLYLDRVSPRDWPSKLRYIYSNETVIIKDTKNKLNKLIEQARMTTEEQMQITVYSIRKLGIRGITYKGICNDTWRGFRWDDPVDYWVKRNDLLSAHSRLNECYELIAMLIFSINGDFMPSSKWRYNILMNLPWLPDNFDVLLKDYLCIYQLSKTDYERRVNSCTKLLNLCIEKAIIENLVPEDFGKYYRHEFQDNTDNTVKDNLKAWKS